MGKYLDHRLDLHFQKNQNFQEVTKIAQVKILMSSKGKINILQPIITQIMIWIIKKEDKEQ